MNKLLIKNMDTVANVAITTATIISFMTGDPTTILEMLCKV